MTRESVVEKYLHAEVTKAGGMTFKFVSPGRRGVPDRIVIRPGMKFCGSAVALVSFVEVKALNKKPRPEQLREHRRLRQLGCPVLVIDTKAKVDKYVRDWLW